MGPAHELLLHVFDLDTTVPPDFSFQVQIVEGGDGRLAVELVDRWPHCQFTTLTRDWRQLQVARERSSNLSNVQVRDTVWPLIEDHASLRPLAMGELAPISPLGNVALGQVMPCDVALLAIPKGRQFARSLLARIWSVLRPGGKLLLAGPSNLGAKPVIADAAALFGHAEVLSYRRHQRVAYCVRQSDGAQRPDWLCQPGIAPGTMHKLCLDRPEGEWHLCTLPGVFSWQSLDEATQLLLIHLRVRPGQRVWDVGCGYGALGLAAAQAGARDVTMTDVDLLALQCTRENAKRLGVANRVRVFGADGVSSEEGRFDLVVSNPTFHRGHDQDRSMAQKLISQSPSVLDPNGSLLLVANRFLPYGKWMGNSFANVRCLGETTKFRVWQGEMGAA